MPERVGKPPLPRLTGYVANNLSLLKTCMVWVRLLMIDTCLAPTLKLDVQSPNPQTPPPTLNPSRSATTVTLVPDGQKVAGRKCTTWSVSQCHPPMTAGVDVT